MSTRVKIGIHFAIAGYMLTEGIRHVIDAVELERRAQIKRVLRYPPMEDIEEEPTEESESLDG